MLSKSIFDEDSKADIPKIGSEEDVKDLSLMSEDITSQTPPQLRNKHLEKLVRTHDIMNDFHRRLAHIAPPIDSHSITRPLVEMDSRKTKSILFADSGSLGEEGSSSSGVQFKETEDGGLLPIFDDDEDLQEPEPFPDIEKKSPSLSDLETWDNPSRVLTQEERLIRRRYKAKIRARKHRAKIAHEIEMERLQQQRILDMQRAIEMQRILDMRRIQAAQMAAQMAAQILPKQETVEELKPFPMEQDIELGNTYITEPHMNAVNRSQFKERRAECQRNRRAMMTDDIREKVREQNRLRQQALRERRRQAALAESAPLPLVQSFLEKKAAIANKMRGRRATMTEEEKRLAREKNAQQSRDRRSRESEEQRAMRRERDAAKQRARRQAVYAEETEKQRNERKKVEAERRRRCHRNKKARSAGHSDENSPEPSGEEGPGSLAVEYPDQPPISANDLVLKMTEN